MPKFTLAVAIAVPFVCTFSAQGHADACQNAKPMSSEAFNALSKTKGMEKGEYETTDAWHQRIAKLFPADQSITAAKRLAPEIGKYDADGGVLHIDNLFMFSDTGAGQKTLKDGSMSTYVAIEVGSHDWTEPGYIGQNAMGVSKPVSIMHLDKLYLYWRPGPYEFTYPDPRDVNLKVKPADAGDLRAHLAVVVSGTPEDPYLSGNNSRQSPTIDNPNDIIFYERGIVVRPTCAALIDTRTNNVLVRFNPLTQHPIRH